ncbi:unnamed protein product [Macrosiphum euphorbiae]|uniref:Uncharacterized protein n=1 Tax=Macrosiphum euphorbiae TaxID=13131 RepID=A0AAV0Y6Y7_9HEMI|nr:unnamed protein product [Macrosiphum euphorbiae]
MFVVAFERFVLQVAGSRLHLVQKKAVNGSITFSSSVSLKDLLFKKAWSPLLTPLGYMSFETLEGRT